MVDRELAVPDPRRRRLLWRATANPGCLYLAGEVAGTWRRRGRQVTVSPFEPLPAAAEPAVTAAAGPARRPAQVVSDR